MTTDQLKEQLAKNGGQQETKPEYEPKDMIDLMVKLLFGNEEERKAATEYLDKMNGHEKK